MNLLLSLLLGCPQPPPAATTATNNPHQQQGDNHNQKTPNGPVRPNNATSGDPSGKGPAITMPTDAKQTQFGYPEADGQIIQGSIIIKINDSGNGDPPPRHTQEELIDIPHVTFRGTITCSGEGCDAPLVLRIAPFQEQSPNGKPAKNGLGGLITTKKLSGIGDYDILIPKSKKPVVLELLVDNNNDGKPTIDERFAVMERGGQLIPYEDMNTLTIDCSNKENFGPIGGAVSPDSPASKPQQKVIPSEPFEKRNHPPQSPKESPSPREDQ